MWLEKKTFMPRKKTILQTDFPYHITARCINQDWFRLNLETVWSIFGDYLFILKHEHKFEIHSLVLMDNHFHLLIKTPSANLSEGMNYFMREVSKEITYQSGRTNQTFGGPYHWSMINSYSYYLNVYKYIYRNPVEAGLADRCESYKFSTLSGLIGAHPIRFPLEEDILLFNPNLDDTTLNWLNTPKPDVHLQTKKALRKSVFEYQKNTSTKRLVVADDLFY